MSKSDVHWFQQLLDHKSEGSERIEEIVTRDTNTLLKNRRALKRESYPEEALTAIAKIIVTRSYYRPIYWKKLELETATYQMLKDGSLETLVESKLNDGGFKNTILGSLQALNEQLEENNTLKEWADERNEHAINGKRDPYLTKLKGVGHKGRDNMLRDLGYFKRTPIDRHEVRFMVRVGIFHRYAPRNADITMSTEKGYQGIHDALSNFAREELKGIKISNIELSEAPGIVDMAIWHFCCVKETESCLGICCSNPKCDELECPIRNHCLFYRKNTDIQLKY